MSIAAVHPSTEGALLIATSEAGAGRHSRFLTLVVSFLATLMVLWTVQDVRYWGEASFIYGLAMAMTVAHFIIDAGVWRLRDTQTRAYIRGQFPFLFGQA